MAVLQNKIPKKVDTVFVSTTYKFKRHCGTEVEN